MKLSIVNKDRTQKKDNCLYAVFEKEKQCGGLGDQYVLLKRVHSILYLYNTKLLISYNVNWIIDFLEKLPVHRPPMVSDPAAILGVKI